MRIPCACKVHRGKKSEFFYLTGVNTDLLIVDVAVKLREVDMLWADEVCNALPDQLVFIHQKKVTGNAVCLYNAGAAVKQDDPKVHGVDQPIKVALQVCQVVALVVDQALFTNAHRRLSNQAEPGGIHALLVAGKNADERGNFVALVKNGSTIADIGSKCGLIVFAAADTNRLAGIETGAQRIGAGSCLQQ